MSHSAFRAVCILGTLLGLIVLSVAQAQQAPQTADGLQAGQDAHQRAEEQRRAEIDRQRQLVAQMRWPDTWAYPRYAPTLADVYGYGLAYGPRRTYRQAVRWESPLVLPAWPRVPVESYGYLYQGSLRPPVGQEKIWSGPNGYVYRPGYAEPPQRRNPALSPRPASPTPAPPPPVGAPDAAPPLLTPVPEAIPAPPSEPGPREF